MSDSKTITEKSHVQLDYRLLELLKHHEKGLTMRELFILLETSDYVTVRYRLRKLGAAGLLKWGWREGQKRYYVTRKGTTLLEDGAYEQNE